MEKCLAQVGLEKGEVKEEEQTRIINKLLLYNLDCNEQQSPC